MTTKATTIPSHITPRTATQQEAQRKALESAQPRQTEAQRRALGLPTTRPEGGR